MIIIVRIRSKKYYHYDYKIIIRLFIKGIVSIITLYNSIYDIRYVHYRDSTADEKIVPKKFFFGCSPLLAYY